MIGRREFITRRGAAWPVAARVTAVGQDLGDRVHRQALSARSGGGLAAAWVGGVQTGRIAGRLLFRRMPVQVTRDGAEMPFQLKTKMEICRVRLRYGRKSMGLDTIGKASALSAALFLGVGVAAAHAQTIELKLSHFIPPNHTFHKWAVAWTEELSQQSGGRLKFQIYPNGQLVGPPNRQFDAARNGITDMAFVLHGVTPGRYATTELVNLAFSWPKAGSSSSITSRRLSELAATYLAKEHEGLHILFMAAAMPILIYSSVPIAKLDDFKGVKIRYAGVQNRNLLDSLGAVPLLIAPPEAQDAIAKGIIQGATFPHEAALSLDLGTVAKHATEPGLSTAPFAFVMNPAKYNSLPTDLKALIDKSTGPAAAEKFGKQWEAEEKRARDELIKQGVQIHVLSEADVAEIKRRVAPQVEAAVAAVEKAGKPGRKFLEEYIK
jgi:TRAP-type transport system periplasmic protein